jgi:diguanylate cyclase (GGDEF)-like protein
MDGSVATVKNMDLQPYLQILQSLVPNARCVAVFGLDGSLLVSSGAQPTEGLKDCANSVLLQLRKAPDGCHIDSRLLVDDALTYALAIRHVSGVPVGLAFLICEPANLLSDKPTVEKLLQSTRSVLTLLARDLAPAVPAAVATSETASTEIARPQFNETAAADVTEADLSTLAKRANAAAASIYIPAAGAELMSSYPGASAEHLAQLRRVTLKHLFPEIAKSGAPMIVNKIREAADSDLVQSRILCMPLKRCDLVVGMITIFNPRNARPFAKDDESLLRRLAKALFAPMETAYDEATGLLSRQAFEHKAARHLRLDSPRPHCIVYGDMDRLHTVNELFGFARGDEILRSVARAWHRSALPNGSLVCRLSGDRFVALLNDVTMNQAHTWAESVRASINEINPPAECSGLKVSASIGIAALPADKTLNYALAASETACKAAKDRGRNRVELFADTDASLMQRHDDLHVFRDLVDALDEGRFQLFAQPLRPLANPQEPVHYELLVRLLDTDGKIVEPGKFLSAATRYQLFTRLDQWVLTSALAKLREFREQIALHSTVFWINLSGQSLAQPDVLEFVRAAVRDADLPPGAIGFEITENAAIGHLEPAQRFMSRLRELGCRFALDDFGTGLSSLKYLKDLQVSMLKIDGSFIRDVLADPRSDSLVRAVLNVAAELGLETTAECIESRQVADHLTLLGVTYGQGFALGRPGPLDDLLDGLWRTQARPAQDSESMKPETARITVNG